MARLLVRDLSTTREFEINTTALPFWADRVEVIGDPIPELGDEPDEAAPAASPPEESGTSKPSKAAKPADDK